MLRLQVAVVLLLSIGVTAQEPIPALPDGITLAVRLEQRVKASNARAGDAVRARLLTPVLLHGKIAIPKDAEIAGQVLEAEPLAPARVSRLTVRFDEAHWRGGSMALRAYIVRHLALKVTVLSPEDRRLCPPIFQFLGSQPSGSTGSTQQTPTQQLPAPQKDPPPPPPPQPFPPPPVRPMPPPESELERCNSIRNPRRAPEKVTFTSPPLAGIEIRHLAAPTGATELASSTKNVELPRGTMLELQNRIP